jgi:hypothetical protein
MQEFLQFCSYNLKPLSKIRFNKKDEKPILLFYAIIPVRQRFVSNFLLNTAQPCETKKNMLARPNLSTMQ